MLLCKLSMVTDGNYTYSGDHYTVHKNVKSFWCMPETNLILYVSKKKGGGDVSRVAIMSG